MKWLKTKWYTVMFKGYLKLRKKKHFDRESKIPRQKRIKSKPIQQNTQSKVTCQTERRREKLNLNTKIVTNPNKISNPNHNL